MPKKFVTANADGKFYCSVARPAFRKNVTFYGSCAVAEHAGFRACKRCQPNGKSLTDEYVAKVAAAYRAIETADEALSLDKLAMALSMSKFHFHRVFAKLTGLTPKAYASIGLLPDQLQASIPSAGLALTRGDSRPLNSHPFQAATGHHGNLNRYDFGVQD